MAEPISPSSQIETSVVFLQEEVEKLRNWQDYRLSTIQWLMLMLMMHAAAAAVAVDAAAAEAGAGGGTGGISLLGNPPPLLV